MKLKKRSKNFLVVAGSIIAIPSFLRGVYSVGILALVLIILGFVLLAIAFGE